MEKMKHFWPLYLVTAVIFCFLVQLTSKTVTTIAESSPVPHTITVVIDAGHGGFDGGATSCTGVPESEINLEIAVRLNSLCQLLGYRTVMIRTDDNAVHTQGNTIGEKKASDLRNRVQQVNHTDGAVLISIHQNTFSDSKYSGAQVFYASNKPSQDLAETMQLLFRNTINPGSNRQKKRADNIYLMQKVHCTAVLVECGFLSNPEEEAHLRDDSYQKQICCVIVSSLSQFFGLDAQTND